MARFNYSGVAITGGTGRLNSSLGGSVLQKNGVVRSYVTPTNPQSAAQIEVRAAFSFLNIGWSNTLTEAQRQAWEAARTGNLYYNTTDEMTGTSRPFNSAKALFTAMNVNALLATNGLAAPAIAYTTPGASNGIDAVGAITLVADASSNTVVLSYTDEITNGDIVVKMTPPVSAGNARLTSVKSKLRLLLAANSVSPISLTAAFTAKNGAITGDTGKKIFYTVEWIDPQTGKATLLASDFVIIVA